MSDALMLWPSCILVICINGFDYACLTFSFLNILFLSHDSSSIYLFIQKLTVIKFELNINARVFVQMLSALNVSAHLNIQFSFHCLDCKAIHKDTCTA